MEFLLTYGWAIVIVVVAVSALAYFGVIDLKKLMPSVCHLPSGLSCLDHEYKEGKFTFVMKNNLGKKIILEKIEASGCDTNRPSNPLENGEKTTLTLNCIKFEGNLMVYYKNTETGLSHTGEGEGSAKGTDGTDNPTNSSATTYFNYCRNANNNGGFLCGMLDKFGQDNGYGDNYRQRCCEDWNLCC